MKIISLDLSLLKFPKRLWILGCDITCTAISLLLAFLLRFNFVIPEIYFLVIIKSLFLLIFLRTFSFLFFGLYGGVLRYAGVDDLLRIIKAVTVSTLLFIVSIGLLFHFAGFPRSVFLIDWFIILVFMGGSRFLYRITREIFSVPKYPEVRRKVLIVGAGDVGEMVLRSIKRERDIPYEVAGFVDDDPDKIGRRIHGVEVLDRISNLEGIVREKRVKEVIIAIQNISGRKIREITDQCQTIGVSCKTVPSVGGILRGSISINHIRPVQVEDLLKREPVQLDLDMIAGFISGRSIMVTGAGGSIGSELCRQIMVFDPRKLILFERGENALYETEVGLREQFHDSKALVPVIGDILDEYKIDQVLKEHTPEVIFHAAAYKHVPIMEVHPFDAVKNNILGTWNMASMSCNRGVQRFVLISTDKAVKPASIMGATKRVAEMICQGFNQAGPTRFVAVRFGNVLESNGSVIPYFRRQIAHGGPVTVTHPEVTRYFMTIPEASQLVLQAGAMGRGGEIYFLEMGDPIKILDLATDLISFSGLVLGEDIDIKFIGLRPGEKLHEELITEQESLIKTQHPKIAEVNGTPIEWNMLKLDIENFFAQVERKERKTIIKLLQRLIPDYYPDKGFLNDQSFTTDN
jgi:FlaA1/EpsC-like NDP-sugar epimerase